MARLCDRCQTRWMQDGRLCRRCGRETGDYRTNRERDAGRVARQRHRRQIATVDSRPIEPRTVVIAGIEYDVVFP